MPGLVQETLWTMNIKLGPPKLTDLKPRITVIGIGGAGCNAINNMIATRLDGVEFIVANTDAQSLAMSQAERRIQLGTNLTEGLGAGARPEVGEAAAREAEEDIRAEIAGSHMVFIAAGMGGGTGTGAASIIAEIARDLGILTVGIVSKPFQFEGARRMRTAEAGIDALEKVVDTLIVIPNQNLFRIANERTTFAEAFRLADQVLYSGIACIVDLIVKEGLINLDFADVRAVMKGMGSAMMGTGEATGEDRALQAANEAIANPLLDNVSLSGAQGLLISIVGGSDLTLYEVDIAASHIRKEVAAEANIIVGATTEAGMDEKIRVSIVASGMAGAGIMPSTATPAVPPPQAIPPTDTNPITYAAPAVAATDQPDGDEPAQESLGRAAATASAASAAETRSERADTGDTAMNPDEADDFAQALNAAMAESEREQAEAGDGMGPWQSVDGVVVEEGFADQHGRPQPPPLPDHRNNEDYDMPPGFDPAPPAETRRPATPRMPAVTDFPEIAQREYFAKMEAAQQAAKNPSPHSNEAGWLEARQPTPRDNRNDDETPPPLSTSRSEPPARPGLLRRLTGGGRM
jgi:cell division protein FtsZ